MGTMASIPRVASHEGSPTSSTPSHGSRDYLTNSIYGVPRLPGAPSCRPGPLVLAGGRESTYAYVIDETGGWFRNRLLCVDLETA